MISSPAQKPAGVGASTGAAVYPSAAPRWDAAPVADFHQERAGVLQPVPRRLAPAAPAARRPRTASGVRNARALDDATVQVLDAVAHGGGAGLDSWLDDSGMDPLERHTLLRNALLQAGGEAQASLQSALERLVREHGAAIEEGGAQQQLLQATLDELHGAADGAPRRAALAQLEHRLIGARAGAPIDAHSLGQALADACCAGQFCTVLATLRRARARAQAPRSRLANSDAQLWLSLKDAASLQLLQSCHAIGEPLHAGLANAGLLAPAPGPAPDGGARAAIGLLGLSTSAAPSAPALLAAIGASTEPADADRVHRLVAHAVRLLPLSLWQQAQDRRALLAGLGGSDTPPRRNPDDLRQEHELRAAHHQFISTHREQ